MTTSRNQALVQSTFECFAKGEMDGILAKLAGEAVFEGPESSDIPRFRDFEDAAATAAAFRR